MTRMPELEQELVAAARRRYSRAPARRLGLGRALRLLAPVAAVLVMAVVAVGALRTNDPELEAPARPTPAPALAELREGPLGASLIGADPRVTPVSLSLDGWTVAAWGGPGGVACQGASRRRPDGSGGSGSACSAASLLAADLRQVAGATAEMLADEGRQLVYGLALPEVKSIDVELAGADHAAKLDDKLLTVVVTEQQRRSLQRDGGEVPPAGPVHLRLFAVSLPGEPSVRDVEATLRVAYANGDRGEASLPLEGPPIARPDAGCFREAKIDTDVAIPAGKGSPAEVCERFWDETGFEGTPKPDRFTVCEGNGSAWVFPGGPGVCRRLGLPRYRRG